MSVRSANSAMGARSQKWIERYIKLSASSETPKRETRVRSFMTEQGRGQEGGNTEKELLKALIRISVVLVERTADDGSFIHNKRWALLLASSMQCLRKPRLLATSAGMSLSLPERLIVVLGRRERITGTWAVSAKIECHWIPMHVYFIPGIPAQRWLNVW